MLRCLNSDVGGRAKRQREMTGWLLAWLVI
jgi:hypothetical protein